MAEKRIIRILKLAVVLLPIFVMAWLFNKHFAPFGKLEVSYDLKGNSPLITELYPGARVEDAEKNLKNGDVYQRFRIDPAYFEVNTPRYFQKATVAVEYENPAQPILEIGIQQSEREMDFLRKPLENKFIDNSDWFTLEDENRNLILLQKGMIAGGAEGISETAGGAETDVIPKMEYASIDDFLSDLPKYQGVATYQINLGKYYRLDNYQKSDSGLAIERSLRGPHQLFTYIKDEPLKFNIYYQDINRKQGADPFVLNVYYGEESVHQVIEADDGNIYPNGAGSELKELKVELDNRPEGSYQLVFDISDDLVIRRIETSQHLLVVKGDIFLADNEEYIHSISDIENLPTELYTNASEVTLTAPHDNGLQTVNLDNTDAVLERTAIPYNLVLSEKQVFNAGEQLKKISCEKGDIMVGTGDYLSFTRDSHFVPSGNIAPLLDATDIDEVDFIVAAGYHPPQKHKNIFTASQAFDLTRVYYPDKTLKFILSAPGLQYRSNIKIVKMTVLLEKEPITLSNIFPKLKNFFSR